MENTTSKLPVGLSSHFAGYEIGIDAGIPFIVQEDGRVFFKDWPISLLDILREEIDKDPRIEVKMAELGIIKPIEQLRMFAACRFGGAFDDVADIDKDNNLSPEYPHCLNVDCKGRNIICKIPAGKFGEMTPRELDIIRLVGEDLADKQIADRLGISPNTVAIHRTNIERKLGCASKVGIAIWGIQNRIIEKA